MNDIAMKRVILTSALIGGFVNLCAGATATALSAANDGPAVSSLTNKVRWSDSANWTAGVTDSSQGYRTGVWQPDPATDYVFANGSTLRPPRFNDYRFIGKSLRLGDATTKKSGAFGVGTSVIGAVQELDFSHSKLVLEKGDVGQYYGTPTRILGPVEITAKPNDTGESTFALRGSHAMEFSKGLAAANNGAGLEFADKVTGAADTMIDCQISAYNAAYSNLTSTNTIIRFTGDLSELYSTVVVRPYPNKGRYEWPDRRRATFSTSRAEMPGKLVLWRGGAIQLWNTTSAFTVDTLELTGDNLLEIPYDFSSGAGASLNVTNGFSAEGVTLIRLVLTGTDDATTAFAHTILTAPAGVTLNLANFALESILSIPYSLKVETDANGRSILVLRHGVTVTLGQADAANTRESFYTSTLPHGWSGVESTEWPTVGKDYVDTGLMLRGPTTMNQVFGGDTLTLRSSASAGATLALRASKSVTINDLRIDAMAAKDVILSHYAAANNYKTTFPYAERGLCLLYGNALVSSTESLNGKFVVQLANGRGFKYGMNLHGDAKIIYQTAVEKAAQLPISHHWLAVANSNLTGRTMINYATHSTLSKSAYNYTWVPTEGLTVPNWNHCTHVYIEDPACFGGTESAYIYDALLIEDYSILHPMKSMTFDDASRGIKIGRVDSNSKNVNTPVARLDVTNGVTLTICQKLNFSAHEATLVKEGAGMLVLGAGCWPTFWNGQNSQPSVSSNNIFRILAGTFKPAASNVCDGLQVSFASGAVMELDAQTADANLLRYGLYNNKWRRGRTDRSGASVYPGRPLALEAGAENYQVRINGGTLTKPPRTMGIFTVGAEYANEIRSRIKITHPFDGYEATITETTFAMPTSAYGGQLVTFSVTFRKGMTVIVR